MQKNKIQCNPGLFYLKNEVICPLRDLLKYWFGWNKGMTCGSTAFHRHAQPSSKSGLNRAHLQTSLEKAAMKWHDSAHALPEWNITVLFFLFISLFPKKTQSGSHCGTWLNTSTTLLKIPHERSKPQKKPWHIKHYSWSRARKKKHF